MSYKCISIDQAKALIDSAEVTLADVRDAGSFLESNIPNAAHVTAQTAAEFLARAPKDKPLIVYCYHGNSSKGAAEYFVGEGFAEVYSMDGGFEEWRTKY